MEREIPRSHIAKHQAAGKKIHHRVLHNGADAAGKFDSYDAAKKRASQYRGQMKKQGYNHKGVKVHHYVSEGNQMKTFFEFRDEVDAYTINLDDLEEAYKPEVLARMKKNYKGKHPHKIHTVSSAGKGKITVVTNSGDKHELTAKDTNGKMPKTGTHINDWKPGAVKEDVEQIDELSKKTLGSYVKKASDDAVVKSALSVGDKGGKRWKATLKRLKGIHKASDKLTKEDSQLDELSKKTLQRYKTKASLDSHKQQTNAADNAFDDNLRPHYIKKTLKRNRGINIASKKLAK